MRRPFALLMLLLSFSVAQAQPNGLLVYNAWVRPTAPALVDGATPEAPLPGTVTGAFMMIENTSDADYQLVSVADDFAELSQIHQMTLDSKGIMRMHAVESVDIPAGQTVTLGSAGYHVMLMNVAHDIYPSQAVALTLTLSDSSGAIFTVPVGALTTDEPPADDPLIVANALAQTDDQALDVSLILDNRGAQADTLTGASSDVAKTVTLVEHGNPARSLDTLDVPPQAQTTLSPDGVFIRLTDLTQPPSEAFVLMLSFKSGKTVTVAVPLLGVGS